MTRLLHRPYAFAGLSWTTDAVRRARAFRLSPPGRVHASGGTLRLGPPGALGNPGLLGTRASRGANGYRWPVLCLLAVALCGRAAEAEEGAPGSGAGEEVFEAAPVPPGQVVEEQEDEGSERDGEAALPAEPEAAGVSEPGESQLGEDLGQRAAPASTTATVDSVEATSAFERTEARFGLYGETAPVFSISRGSLALGILGSLQLLGVPFVQDPYASLESGSIANTEGFRLRRARFGVSGSLASWLELRLLIELRGSGADILDAALTFAPHPLAVIHAGAFKIPFSRLMMLSSEYQSFLQRPYAVRTIAPDRGLGLMVAGRLPWLSYYAGVWNGGGDYYRGDNNEGMLYAGRLEVHPLGPLPPGEITLPDGVVVQAAGSYYYNQDATGDRHAATGELVLRWSGLTVQGEVLWSTFDPAGEPRTVEGIEYGQTERLGWFAEASYFVLPGHLQLAFRYEGQLVSEAVEIRDLSDLWAVSGAVNGYLLQGRLKLSLVYEHRREWFDVQVPNDYLALQVQGRL